MNYCQWNIFYFQKFESKNRPIYVRNWRLIQKLWKKYDPSWPNIGYYLIFRNLIFKTEPEFQRKKFNPLMHSLFIKIFIITGKTLQTMESFTENNLCVIVTSFGWKHEVSTTVEIFPNLSGNFPKFDWKFSKFEDLRNFRNVWLWFTMSSSAETFNILQYYGHS